MKAVIGIDAGHGGSSSGTYSVNTVSDGLFEKDYALELALLMEEHLKRNGFEVIMTRRTDENPGNVSKRAEIVAEKGADFALSIHFNGFEKESANGTEIYVPYSETVAEIEAGFNNTLEKYFKKRLPFARSNSYFDRNKIFDKKLNLEKRRFDAKSAEKDYFGFVRGCWEKSISADLIEICFLTNKKDFETYLLNRKKIAEELSENIVKAFGESFLKEENPPEKPVIKPRIRRKFDLLN